MRTAFLLAAVLVGLALVPVSRSHAQAWVGGGGGQYYSAGQSLYWLLTPQMQKELELVEDQKTQLQKVQKDQQAKTQEAYKTLNDANQADRFAKWGELQKTIGEENEKKIAEILLPHQKKRLTQIMLQMRMQQMGYGSAAALSGDDVKDLGITDAQREQLKKVEQELRTEIQTKTQEFYKKLNEESREKLLSVLTPAQRKQLDALHGEKFEWSYQLPGANPRVEKK